MSIYTGGIVGVPTTSLDVTESVLDILILSLSEAVVKERDLALSVLTKNTDKKTNTFSKQRVLWSLSREE